MKKKAIRIAAIILFSIVIIAVGFLLSIYIDAKYRKREASYGKLGRPEITLSDDELIIHAEMYPGLSFYQGYECVFDNDSVYVTIYWTMLAQDEEDNCSFTEHISGDFKNVVKVYLRHDGIDELIYER